MRKRSDNIWIGALLTLLWPVLVMFIYYLIYYHYLSIHKFIALVNSQGSWVPRIKLCVYANLIPFFVFLRLNLYYAARGAILSTLLYTALVIYLMYAL
jgi:hypothetical protein